LHLQLLLDCHLLISLQPAIAQLFVLLLWLLLLHSMRLLLVLLLLLLLLLLQLLLHQMFVCSFSNLRHRGPPAPHLRRTRTATASPL
jgi:hypothetical protein